MGKMAHTTPSGNKSDYLGKKVKVEHKPNYLKVVFFKPTGFACLLYAKVLEISDGSPIFCKKFVEIYGLFVEGMSPKRIKILRDLIARRKHG